MSLMNSNALTLTYRGGTAVLARARERAQRSDADDTDEGAPRAMATLEGGHGSRTAMQAVL